MNDSLVGEIKKIFIDIYYISVSSREQDEAANVLQFDLFLSTFFHYTS